MEDIQSLPQAFESINEVNKAEQMLGQILELFADAESISAKFKTRGGRAEQRFWFDALLFFCFFLKIEWGKRIFLFSSICL